MRKDTSDPEAMPKTSAPMPKAKAIGISASKQNDDEPEGRNEDEHGYSLPAPRRCDRRSTNWLSACNTM